MLIIQPMEHVIGHVIVAIIATVAIVHLTILKTIHGIREIGIHVVLCAVVEPKRVS